MWSPRMGVGVQNLSPSGNGFNIILLWLIEKLAGSIAITNFILIFSIYFFPFLAMNLVCKEIKASPFIAFVISYFYVVNPFTLYYLTCLNQWNVFSVTVMPLFLWIILKYYRSNIKLFFFFGLLSTCLSFAYSNMPMLATVQISVMLSLLFYAYYHNERVIFKQFLIKYCLVLLSFILFNFWWIICFLFSGAVATAKGVVSAAWAHSWLGASVSGHGAVLAKMFSLTTIIGSDPSYDFFSFWYNSFFARIITLIPIVIVVYFVLIVRDKKTSNQLNHFALATLLIVLFFVKGNSGPLGFIYNVFFKYLPFFYMFKSPVEKFGLLYIFIFTVLLLLIFLGTKKHKYYKSSLRAFTCYLIFCSVPILTGNIIPDYKTGNYGYCSRRYKDKIEYSQFRKLVSNEHFQYRILSLPGCGNYQVCMLNYNGKKYTGLDPVLMNIDKPSIADHNQINVLFKNISLKSYAKLLTVYNIGKIVINKDQIPWFGTFQKESIAELEEIFGRYFASTDLGSIVIYDNQDHFLTRIYVSDKSN